MQRGFTNKRPVKILGAQSPDPVNTRQVKIFNNSGVSIWLGDDENSATSVNGVPVLAGTSDNFLWPSELWVGADVDFTEFRYMISPQFQGAQSTSTWEELGKATPPPPKYYNRPIGR